jgi:large subunit ribosomal protein L29
MSLSNFQEIQNLTIEQLDENLLALKKELLSLRFKQSVRKKSKAHLFIHIKHRISQILYLKSQLEKSK